MQKYPERIPRRNIQVDFNAVPALTGSWYRNLYRAESRKYFLNLGGNTDVTFALS